MKYHLVNDAILSSENLLEKYERARLRELNNQLEIAIVGLEMGRLPPPEEIAKRGHRVVYPNGRIEWWWDTTCILVERDGIGDFVPWKPEPSNPLRTSIPTMSATTDTQPSPGGAP